MFAVVTLECSPALLCEEATAPYIAVFEMNFQGIPR
jgi:hypothetical protein